MNLGDLVEIVSPPAADHLAGRRGIVTDLSYLGTYITVELLEPEPDRHRKYTHWGRNPTTGASTYLRLIKREREYAAEVLGEDYFA